MIPGFSRNCRRTSNTIAPAARVTALIARPENMNTTDAPMMTPTRVFGAKTSKAKAVPTSPATAPASASATVMASR
jgi:hypothetical protein